MTFESARMLRMVSYGEDGAFDKTFIRNGFVKVVLLFDAIYGFANVYAISTLTKLLLKVLSKAPSSPYDTIRNIRADSKVMNPAIFISKFFRVDQLVFWRIYENVFRGCYAFYGAYFYYWDSTVIVA